VPLSDSERGGSKAMSLILDVHNPDTPVRYRHDAAQVAKHRGRFQSIGVRLGYMQPRKASIACLSLSVRLSNAFAAAAPCPPWAWSSSIRLVALPSWRKCGGSESRHRGMVRNSLPVA